MITKTFPLRVVLTVTTGRLLTKPKDGGNGIGDLYDILGFMTESQPFTHQLPRLGNECKTWLLKWFPELEQVNGHLTELDRLLQVSKKESCEIWLSDLPELFPNLKSEYEVKVIPCSEHTHVDPLEELSDMMSRGQSLTVIEVDKKKMETVNQLIAL